MTQLTDHEKITIVCLHKKGKSIKEISEILNVNRNTISKWISRENLTGYVLRKKGSGRKENINNDGIIKVINIIQNDTYITLDKIYEKLNNINNKVNDQKNEVKLITEQNGGEQLTDSHVGKISIYMIRKILKINGYQYGIPPTIFPLTEEHKKRRLEFAIKCQNLNFSEVDFTDEVSFWKNNEAHMRWHNKTNIFDRDILYKHAAKLNAWGYISYNSKRIHVFSENMNAVKYVDILTENYLNYYEKNHYILYDNDPKHNSIKSKTFWKKIKLKY